MKIPNNFWMILVNYKIRRFVSDKSLPTHYFSFIDNLFKINEITTLLEREFNISSGYNALHKEFMKLKDYFNRNWYFIRLIKNMNTTVATIYKTLMPIKLPYYGTSSLKIRKELTNLLENSFGYINFKITFINLNRIKLFFPTRTEFWIKYVQALYISISVLVVAQDISRKLNECKSLGFRNA